MTEAKKRGNEGEEAAALLLLSKGLRILDRNWRSGVLELDLVCSDCGTIVFVEVKTRRHGGLTLPAEALGKSKRLALQKASRAWLAAHEAWSRPCRFDLVLVTYDGQRYFPEHLCDVFDFSRPLDSRHSDWQPW